MNGLDMKMEILNRDEWNNISQRLQEPFDPTEVDFRVQGRANEQTGRAQVVAYIDARAVQDRLDEVVGAGNWSFDWIPLVIDKGEVMVAKGTLTIMGVSKSDAGSASNFEQTLGAVSHCFKRAAVHWGIGRYLYNLPMNWVSVEKNGRIPDAVLRELRAKLPKPTGTGVIKPNTGLDREMQARVLRETPATELVGEEPRATEKQVTSIHKLCEALGKPEPVGDLSYAQARELLTQLSGEYQRARRAS
ncbi:MAG: Putative DNA-binding protein Erf [Ktedonobacterales bacterium]|jgi:hypothetical protein|nr:MAG: Putative DNA-binding protein Erf [Ktedonobacterales bacterium]